MVSSSKDHKHRRGEHHDRQEGTSEFRSSKDKSDGAESDDSTDSESDYQNSTPYIDYGPYSQKDVLKAWKAQRGICRITGVPMSGKTGLYSPLATLRVFSKPPTADNVIVVCRVIHEMRNGTTLPWRQFAQIMKIFGDQIGSGFQF